ncbi:MAG: hypothetical protein CMM52_07125 [Rhodospirillaceae bacterium]|nr:hypothetical protein [Rhodospirillaceae bacterium]|tara:strand:+ start:40611 stop:41060 length:450 start_codon:yes stop_codon:yes gene_type:complete
MSVQINKQVEALIRVTSRLIGVLDSEVDMLRAMQVDEIENLQAEKKDLTVLYEETVRSLAAQPEALEAVEPALRTELSELAGRFDTALAENARALNAVRDSHDRLLKAIVDAVSENRAKEKGYTRDGKLGDLQKGRNSPSLSLSVDRQL